MFINCMTIKLDQLLVPNDAVVNVTHDVFTGPPTIITHPTSQLTTMSMSVTLDCEGTGNGKITYHWESKGIDSRKWMNIRNSNRKKLVVRNLEQSQQYRCVVSNKAGSPKSNIATVTVLSEYTFCDNYYILINNLINRDHHSASQFYQC